MAATTAIEDYPTEVLNCPICQNGFRNPKMLPCLHTFCQQCLGESLDRSNIVNGQGFLCPICRYECQVPKRGVPALPHNVFYETLQEYFARKGESPQKNGPPPKNLCDACDSGDVGDKKCIECDDWLCAQCVDLHQRVKVTRTHHLVTPTDLGSGGYDGLIKDSFEPLICGKHEEPLKLYCTESSCLTPICTVCKTTLGHDGHRAIQLSDQAERDLHWVESLINPTQASIDALHHRVANCRQEEKITATVKKKMHKEINQRLEEVLAGIVKQVSTYAEGLHEQVEKMAKDHRADLAVELESADFALKGMINAHLCATSLVRFGRPEEVVAMGRSVCRRLEEFRRPSSTAAPGWRHPRLHPAERLDEAEVQHIFGRLTFEGEVIRCVLLKTISTKLADDTKDVALSDIAVTEDNDIIVVDKDNKKVKVFDQDGQVLFTTDETHFRAPNRITILRATGNAIVKDEKVLRVLAPDGQLLGQFGSVLKHPVASCQDAAGDVLVTDWVSGQVHRFSEAGQALHSFESNMEAPAYIAANRKGQVVISDWKKHEVRAFNGGGEFLFRYGGEGAGPGQLNHPYGVAADARGNLLVADNWNHRVHLLSESGRFLRFLLTKEEGLQWPQALCVDKTGHLLVAELHGAIKVYQYLA